MVLTIPRRWRPKRPVVIPARTSCHSCYRRSRAAIRIVELPDFARVPRAVPDGASLGPTPPCGVMRRQGNADLRPVLPVGAGTTARSAARGVYQAAVRMMLNAGVPAERRTPAELGVLPVRPPAAGCADRRSAFPDRRRHPDRWRTRGTCIFTATARRSGFPCVRAARESGAAERAKTMAANLWFAARVTGGKV